MKATNKIKLSQFLAMSSLFITEDGKQIHILNGHKALLEGKAVHARNNEITLTFNRDEEVDLLEDDYGQHIELVDLWNKIKLYPIHITPMKSKIDYSQFLFIQVVNADIINPKGYNLPFAFLEPILSKHYAEFKAKDKDDNVPEQEAIEHYVLMSDDLKDSLKALHVEYNGEFTHECPHCKKEFNVEDKGSGYQVNDNDEQTYCSYECSAVATLQHLNEELLCTNSMDSEQLTEIIENT